MRVNIYVLKKICGEGDGVPDTRGVNRRILSIETQ